MANPQVEDGHTDIANEIVDHFCRLRLSGREWQVVWAVIRKTWGWHKKEDWISLRQVSKMTKVSSWHCHEILEELVRRKVLKRTDPKNGITSRVSYGIQKDFQKWIYRKPTDPKNGIGVIPKTGSKVIPNSGSTKEKKETIQKKRNQPPAHHPFWTEDRKRQFNIWAIELKHRSGRFNAYEFLNMMRKKYRDQEIFAVVEYMSAHPKDDLWAYGTEALKGKEEEREKGQVFTNLMKHVEETHRLKEEEEKWLGKNLKH